MGSNESTGEWSRSLTRGQRVRSHALPVGKTGRSLCHALSSLRRPGDPKFSNSSRRRSRPPARRRFASRSKRSASIAPSRCGATTRTSSLVPIPLGHQARLLRHRVKTSPHDSRHPRSLAGSVQRSKRRRWHTRQRRTIGLAFHRGEPNTSGADRGYHGRSAPRWPTNHLDIFEPSAGEIKSTGASAATGSSQAAKVRVETMGLARRQATSLARALLTISESVPEGPTTRHMPG